MPVKSHGVVACKLHAALHVLNSACLHSFQASALDWALMRLQEPYILENHLSMSVQPVGSAAASGMNETCETARLYHEGKSEDEDSSCLEFQSTITDA